MRYIHTKGHVVVKSWCDELDEGTLEQVTNLAKHPEVCFPIALMPDAHQGYGMPIGGVIATKNSLIPYAVGMDIGCGMIAIGTDLHVRDLERHTLAHIIDDINATIPMGFNQHEQKQEWDGFDFNEVPVDMLSLHNLPWNRDDMTIEKARLQLGTLGGGNHFIELQKDKKGYLWVMLHSGSRKLGHTICTYYHKRAKMHCERWHSRCVPDLSFLPFGERDARDYYESLMFAQDYAQANREHMMRTVLDILEDNVGSVPVYSNRVNIHHNFARQENHFGENVWVHRKGATQAQAGQMGIIPGSMGTKSYIVRGKGNAQSFESCSHGAGRRMGRKEFCRTHDLDAVNKSVEHVVFGGWKTDRKGKTDYSEAPEAYKDIDTVMAAQEDLVEILYELRPLAVTKG